MGKAKENSVTVILPQALYRKALAILENRGTTFDDFVRLSLRRLVKNEKFYGLGDKFTFGKFEHETIEMVIRTEPTYLVWCLKNVDGFALTIEALELLTTMDVDFGND